MHGSNNLSSIKQKQLYALDEQNFKRKIVFYNSLCHDLTNCNRWDYSYSREEPEMTSLEYMNQVMELINAPDGQLPNIIFYIIVIISKCVIFLF